MTPIKHSGLRLPQQDLERCSLFDCNVEAVESWARELPLGSPLRAGSNLRNAISELNRVALPPQERFELLEVLRTPLDTVLTALIRGCLNQPIILDNDKQIQADLITDLCSLAAAGYTISAVHTIKDNSSVTGMNPAKLACESLHRAMTLSGQRILVAYILYQPVELNGWAGLHQLYSLSERQQLARLPVEDSLRGTRSNIAQEYLPALLLACSKPNQLRQHDITGAYRAFQEWRDLAQLQDPELGEGLFAVDMLSDQAPAFSELLVRRGSTQFRYINTKALIAHLEELKKSRGTQGLRTIEFDRETRLDTNLLEHLVKSLGEISQRNFNRQQSRSTLHIATGLSNVHYFVAGERSLEEVFHGSQYDETQFAMEQQNPFLSPASHGDKWQQANSDDEIDEHAPDEELDLGVDADKFSSLDEEQAAQSTKPIRHTVYSVKTTNTSPGGYCVEWTDPPDGIHIGDLVCMREEEMEQADWTVAVIRWVSQVKHAPTLLGLELISPRAGAYAAQIKMPDGELSKPIRVLLLPEIPLVGQAHTLVVPRMVFKEGQRITVTREEDSALVKLKRQVSSTGYFSQMDFEYLRQLDDDIESSKREQLPTATFDSIWTDI
ncbi:GTPase [Congregibacter variabilis]|uniref:GTPase n=1 Tax=Congregibacter variabilis TaxID=3081200 RepID=A0ABZ0I1U2_9GAMM|nr:GTPase [Congregibacter sp. IMCC43200]